SLADDTHLTMTFCAPSSGTWDVVVANSYGASPLVPTDQFTTTGPVPTITSVSPASGPGTGGTTLLITGSGLTGATAVSVGSPVASFTVLDDATISAVTPNVLNAADQQLFTTVDVRVTTPGGTSAITPADQFTYLPTGSLTPTPTPSPTPTSLPPAVPTLSGFTPTTGPGGTLVTLTGSNLTVPGGASVLFTGCAVASTAPATQHPDGTLTVTVPACAQTGPLTVLTAGGSATSAQSFTVT